MIYILFCIFAVFTVLAALTVVLARNPITSATALLGTLLGVSALFALINSGFLAIVQVLVYGGAVVTLFVFVVMLLNLRPEDLETLNVTGQKVFGVVIAGTVLGSIASTLARLQLATAQTLPSPVETTKVAEAMFLRYLLPFEVTSVLILSAIVGVIALGRKVKSGEPS